jgi:transcriptional regulator with XRE-family HTH domain
MADDVQLGRMVRDVRRARKLSQAELADRARVGRETVSRLERGLVDGLSVGTLRAVSRALGMPSIASLGWRGPEMDRLRDRVHASMVERVGRTLLAAGWAFDPEYTFNYYGEKGAVDALGWHAERRTLLIGEIKTKIWDLQDMLSTLDRKRRVAPARLERERGWRAENVGVVLFLPELSTHRHLIERHAATFGGALPDRQVHVRRWICDPVGSLRGIYFLPDSHQTDERKPQPTPRSRL